MGIPNSLTMPSTLYKNCFQYIGVPPTELINENALSLAKNLLSIHFKLSIIITVSVTGLLLCKTKFIDVCKWY